MKKRVLACLAMTLMAGVLITQTSKATSIQDEKDKKEQMEQNLSDANEILKSLESLKSDTESYITEMDNKLNAIMANIHVLDGQIVEKQQEIDQTNTVLEQQQKDIEEQYAAMKLRIQFMFENGSDMYLDMIFGSENMADFLNRAEYVQQITSYDRSMLEKMKTTKAAIEETKSTLVTEKSTLDMLKKTAEAEQNTVETLIADKTALLEKTNQQISSAEADIKAKQDEIKGQEALIQNMEEVERRRKAEEEARRQLEELKRKQAEEEAKRRQEEQQKHQDEDDEDDDDNIDIPSYSTTGFMFPIQDGFRISSPYGYREDPINGTTAYHNGLDIACPTGTPIYAVNDGQVAWAYYSSSAGNWIGIDHGDGIYSVYMHSSLLLVSEGEYVKKGQVIALVGTTGRSTGPHLHLSFRKDGEYVDPGIYVSY